MKFGSFVLSFSLFAIVAGLQTNAFAWPYHHPYYHPYHHWRHCSPEVTQNTTTVVQKVLTDAAISKDFESATSFHEFVASTNALKDANDKLHAYLNAVGVDSKDANAVAQFIGARDHSTYVAAAEKNLGLTQTQADVLIQNVTASLLNLMTNSKN